MNFYNFVGILFCNCGDTKTQLINLPATAPLDPWTARSEIQVGSSVLFHIIYGNFVPFNGSLSYLGRFASKYSLLNQSTAWIRPWGFVIIVQTSSQACFCFDNASSCFETGSQAVTLNMLAMNLKSWTDTKWVKNRIQR